MTELYDVPYEIFMWREIFNCCLIVILTMFALYLIHKMRQKEEGSAQRNIYLGYSLFLIFYGLVRLFFIFSDCEVYNTHSSETFLNNIYVGMAYSFGIIGAICIFYMIERYLVHTRYIFTIIGIAILGLSIISTLSLIPTEIPQLIMALALPAFFVLIVLLYLYVAIKSPGEARKRAFGIIIGILVIMVGILLGSKLIGGTLEAIGFLYEIRILIEPFIVIAGGAIFTFSQR